MGKCMSKPTGAVSDDGGVNTNTNTNLHHPLHSTNVSSPVKKNPIGSVPSHVTTLPQGHHHPQQPNKHKAQSSAAIPASRPPPIPTTAKGSRPPTRQKLKKNTSKRRKSPSSNGMANSSNVTTSSKNAKYHQSESNELWKDIFLMAKTSIIDPADVHAVIDERMSAVINLTNPAEITLIQRRLREISRSLVSTNPAAITTSTMGNMMGRLTKNGNGGKDATSTDDARSRTVYQKEFALDENLFRKLFVAAERIIYKGYKYNLAHTTREKFGSGIKAPDRPRTDDSSNYNDDIPSDEERSQFSSVSQQSLNTSFSRRKKKNRHQQNTSHNQMENNLDPIGSAYLLLLYLSENRWDYVANVATNTAKKAKLILDVNKKTTDSAMTHPKIKDQSIPSPTYLSSGSTTNADSSTAPPSLPNGVSFQAICFIISLALKGTRQQKITLLFYLLLPFDVLKSMLNSHPAGGTPTWLLEVGTNEFISFASLSHYYYYGGALPFETIDGKRITNGVKQLSLNSKNVIEVIAILLYGDQTFASSDESETAAETNSSQTKKEKGDKSVGSHTRSDSEVSVGNEHSSKVHSYMTKCLREIREGTMKSVKIESQIISIGKAFQKFWAVSEESFDSARAWNFEDFSDWTNQALDENSLNAVLEHIFGHGIIPSASLERLLVEQTWLDWQQSESVNWVGKNETADAVSLVAQGFRNLFNIADDHDISNGSRTNSFYRTWGHIGGLDGKGGLGYGIMYCVDKNWWEQWLKYTNADLISAKKGKPSIECHMKPHDLSNEKLLEKDTYTLPGTQGSYEVMKQHLTNDKDYVLIPPAVWDLLFELYGGGPPLPRMVLPFTIMSLSPKTTREDDLSSIEVSLPISPLQIPQEMSVMTHPWIINCQICDPHQPYRRGEVGPLSIRIMSSPDQPMWRLFSEIVTRLHISYPRVKDSSSQGHARLWKRVENTQESSSGASRYGPWALLYKSRFATFPLIDGSFSMKEESIDFYKKDWEEYSDHSTVDSIGLKDGSRLMLEYAIMRKDGIFTWPREAAAKAGRLRRVADEDSAFRRLLRGVDEDGKVISGRSPLIGKLVDAMDASGRWYQVEITAIDTAVEDSNDDDSENENGYMENGKTGESKTSDGRNNPGEIKVVRVDFSEFGGHDEWIDVNSDRIAVSGRFTMDSIRSLNVLPGEDSSPTTLGDSKSRTVAGSKRSVTSHDSSTDLTSTGAVCPFPGFGACGLSNLGNTCYANSALQCISYMPLLRSYLLSNQYKICGDLNKDNPLGTGGKLLEEFSELLKLMWSAKFASRAPTRFRAQVGKARQQYAAADQQDAQELLNDMLDTLHEDSNKVKKKPYVEALEDEWVKLNALSRVGNEAWRRFLRRNSSVIADVAMGQVLNRVTCVVCNHTSRNFDPFNMLSIPFPTVSEVIFRCRVLRRASHLNCSSALSISPDSQNGDSSSFEKKAIEKKQLHPPSTSLAMEEYVIPMSRLADIGDLKLQIQKLCGISANRLKLCKSEEIVSNPEAEVKSRSRTYIKVSPLPDKEGPCVQLAKQGPTDDVSVPVSPTTIIAFEFTLNSRPFDAKKKEALKNDFENENSDDSTNDDTTADEDEEDETMALHARRKASHQKTLLQEQCALYGDSLECRLYDTNPLPLAKAMSRSMWPKSPAGFKLGLRVDAIDHRDHWFPGSVVEIIQGSDDSTSDDEGPRKGTKKTQVRIHFDNFSSKWDEKYTIEHFQRGQVRPLYSHANPKAKPTEFQVHHRHNRTGKTNSLFGQSFFVQCHIEWSTVRAGAQILAQAARFLQPPPFYSSGLENLDNDEVRKIVWQRMDQLGFHRADMPNDKELEVYKTTSELNAKLSEIIDVLIDADKLYVASALRVSSSSSESSTNPSFNISAMSSRLSKKLTFLLPMLPFEIRICASDSPLGNQQGTNSDEVVFPFSLVRTIGNYMNARHAVVLHWKDSVKSSRSPRFPLMYIPPFIGVHKRGRSILNAVQKTVSEHNKKEKNRRSNESGSNGGIPLGVCLTEFCKEQQSECWRCPKCKDIRDTKQSMALWRLPDLLTFHLKRYNCSARWREKITTKVNFPLTSLNMKEWCDQESPAFNSSEDSFVYDLIGVVNHYGGMTGGHYVATCKATPCGSDGSEEVSHSFNGAGINVFETGEESSQSIGWKIGRNKDKDSSTTQTRVAISNAKSVAESSEPLWLQFDDDLVEPIPPNTVVSEMAYVLFYRRRRISPSNIAKYSTLE